MALINFVLFGISNYWAQCIFLPVGVCKEIEKYVRSFLWTGAGLDKHKTKIAWSFVGRSKDEGGLGIKRLQEWDVTCMGTHILNLCSKKDILFGAFDMLLTQKEISYMRFNSEDSMADVWGRHISFTSRSITPSILKVQEAMSELNGKREDVMLWDNCDLFSSSKGWSSLRLSSDKVVSHMIIWSRSNVPKH
ncbi:hypothetical protein LIER_39101 [Lithospermum erythrorhizon]|uniref:Uncharacterized protein n=1 Tax=Lithospermum erythrorhizon TaxID=34254 RepID=A0AAV3QC09_LITER